MFRVPKATICACYMSHTCALRPCVQMAFFALLERILVSILPLGQGISLVAQVENLSALQETWVRSLGWEDPLEKGTVTYSSIRAWRIPWKEKPGGLQAMGSQKVGHN